MTGPYLDLAAPDFLADLSRLTATLDREIEVPPGEDHDWVVYGSRVTGAAHATSDVDVLMLHHDELRPPARVGARYDGAPVTVYALPWSALRADGEHRAAVGDRPGDDSVAPRGLPAILPVYIALCRSSSCPVKP